MTVAELIEALQKLDPKRLVVIALDQDPLGDPSEEEADMVYKPLISIEEAWFADEPDGPGAIYTEATDSDDTAAVVLWTVEVEELSDDEDDEEKDAFEEEN